MALILKKKFSKTKARVSIILLSVLCLSACSTQTSFDSSRPLLFVKWTEPHKINFQGKGIGAGIALMSSMGAMGMAIGVAIDEGISKDLTSSQAQSSQPLKNLITKSAPGHNILWLPNAQPNEKQAHQIITIEKLGFKLQSGKNDPVCGEVVISIVFPNNKKRTLHYPDDFKHKTDFHCPLYDLEKLKNDSQLINTALEELINTVFLLAAKHTNASSMKPTLNKT